VTCHQTLVALANCVPALLESSESRQVVPLLEAVVQHKSNPYWLVKVIILISFQLLNL